MTILAVDTSGPVCGVALVKDSTVLCELTVQNHLTHSVNLMRMVDEALSVSSCTLDDVDRIGCVTGPGSFTGVRIGVSTVKGLAHGSGKPCVAVDALEALACCTDSFQGVICPIQDARAGQVYGAAFLKNDTGLVRLMNDEPLKLEEYLERISAWGDTFFFTGDGMPVHRWKIASILGDKAVFASPYHAFLRPSAVADLAGKAPATLDYTELMPLYLRAPNAERNKKLVEASHAEGNHPQNEA